MPNKLKIIPITLQSLLVLAFLHGSLFASQSLDKEIPVQRIQDLPVGVSIHVLDNGMQILLIENPVVPMVGVNVVVKVGSAYETFATSGMSHMLEHLLFNGTTNRTQKQLYDDVDRIGGYNNAHTSEYYTNYMMVTPTDNIRLGMEIQADMLFNSILPEDKFEKEKGIVLEEISKSLANPTEQVERNVLSVLYPGHALSLPTLGTYATIEAMMRSDVYNFYKNNYVPNNMILSAIGNFRTDDILVLIKEIYGTVKPAPVLRKNDSEWFTGFQNPFTNIAFKETVYHRFYDGGDLVFQMFFPLSQLHSSGFWHMLDIVLNKNIDAIKSQLRTEFPDQFKALKINTRSTPLIGFIEITVTLNDTTNFGRLQKAISNQLHSMLFSLPAENVDSEIARARTNFLKNIEKPHMFGIYNANEFAVKGIEAVLSNYSGIDLYQAAESLNKFSIAGAPIILIQHPSGKKEHQEMGSPTGAELITSDGTGPTLIVVQNQVSDLLAIHYLVKHKAYYESLYGKGAAKILHDCLEQRLQSDANQKLSGRFGLTYVVNDNPYIPMDDIYLHPDFGYIRVEGLADDMSGAIEFLNNQMKGFKPSKKEFNKAVEKFSKSAPMMMGGNRASEIFEKSYKSLVFEPAKYPEGPAEITYETILEFTKDYFRPANMIVSIVSPATTKQIDGLFQDFTAESSPADIKVYSERLRLPKEPKDVIQDQGGERAYLFWGFIKEIDANDKPALRALSLILADQIIFDIREKQGMAYHMKAGIEIIEDKALFYINQGTRSQNVDTLVPQYPGFFQVDKISSVTQEDLQKSINMYLGRMMFRRLSSINRAYYLAHSFYFHGDANYDREILDKLKNVNLEQVKYVAKKYLATENPILLIVH